MHFTLWPSRTANAGGHAEITWETFLGFVSSPAIAAEKNGLEGWSPAKFAGDRRKAAAAELVSAIVLDDDATGLPLERIAEMWGDVAGVVHSSHSHLAGHPKWRIVLRVSRDMSPDEHARVWLAVYDLAAARGQELDEKTKDPSRLWFVPAHRDGAAYEWRELTGEPLDVDAILTAAPATRERAPTAPAPAPHEHGAPADRRRAMAIALGSSWPAKGRHEAQLALAGALRAEGWTAEDALEFLCLACKTAGDEDRPKREATIRHTWARDAGAPITGWTRLKSHVDGVLVDAARAALGRDAEWTERTNRRLTALTDLVLPVPAIEPPPTADSSSEHVRTKAGLVFRSSGWDEPLTPPVYIVESLLVEGSVTLFVAHGNSLKSMTTLSIALAVASGRPWLNHFPVIQGPALVVDYERNSYEARRRVKLLRADGVTGLLHATQPNLRTDDALFWEDLASLGLAPKVLVIDSLAAGAMGTDENERGAALPLQLAQKFAQVLRCAIVFVHHARKGSGGDKRESVRGSTAIYAAVDAVYHFEPIEGTDDVKRMRIECIKMNLGREPQPFAVALSDEKGLVFFEEPAAKKGRNAENSEEVRAAIRLALTNRPVAGIKELTKAVGRREDTVKAEWKIMLERREALKIGDRYHLDDQERREARVLALVKDGGRYHSAARLANAAHVSTSDVEMLLEACVIVREIGNDSGGFLPGPCWPK